MSNQESAAPPSGTPGHSKGITGEISDPASAAPPSGTPGHSKGITGEISNLESAAPPTGRITGEEAWMMFTKVRVYA